MSVATVRVTNPANRLRTSLVTVGLPFNQGQLQAGAQLVTDQNKSVHLRDHLYWPDGSIRWAAAEFTATVQDVASVKLLLGTHNQFYWHNGIEPGLWDLRPAGFTVVGGGQLDSGPATQTFYSNWRRDDGMMMMIIVSFITNQPFADLTILYGFCDPSVSDVKKQIGEVQLITRNCDLVFNFAYNKLVSFGKTGQSTFTYTVHKAEQWADGQMQCLTGRVRFWSTKLSSRDVANSLAEQALPTTATPFVSISEDWPQRPWLTPFGYMPAAGPGGLTNLAINMASKIKANEPWQEGIGGMASYPGRTGAQDDFGAVNQHCWSAAMAKFADMLWPLSWSAAQEWCRPVQHREVDCSPFRHSQHPNCLLVGERPFWQLSQSPDQLGKTGSFAMGADTHGWYAYDRQHDSENLPLNMLLITGARHLVMLADARCDRWLSEHQVDSRNNVVNSVGAGRQGRSLQAGALLAWVTGRVDVADQLRNRVEVSHVRWWEKGGGLTQPHEPKFLILGPDARTLNVNHWRPWEVAQRIQGLAFIRELFAKTGQKPSNKIDEYITIYGNHLHDFGYKLPDLKEVGVAVELDKNEGMFHGGITAWSFTAAQVCAPFNTNAATIVERDKTLTDRQNWRIAP